MNLSLHLPENGLPAFVRGKIAPSDCFGRLHICDHG